MGTGISTVCGSKRSVLISNSVRKLPTIHENDQDSDIDVDTENDINPTSGKLHAAESRDSGIGENDVPNGYLFHRQNISTKNLSHSSPEKIREQENDNDRELTTRVSRPHSCRLGHRGHTGTTESAKTSSRTDLSESQIRRLIRSAKGESVILTSDQTHGDLSDDTLSLNSVSSASPDRRTNNRPKSARKRLNRRNRNNKKDARNSTRIISDLDSSTDTETSDTDMLSIPDETGAFYRSKDNTPRRKGWVRNEDFTDVMISSSVTPRVGGPTDMYRIVSGTYSDMDINLAKKASERSISSIILTPMDGMSTPTNQECFDAPSDLCNHCEGNLEDLVTSMAMAIEKLRLRGLCSPADYENVLRSLRYQLVAMTMGFTCQQSTPRIEVKGQQTNIFSEEEWKVQIRLRTDDEEVIETSEKLLSQRLSAKGNYITREDISILLAEHLKTIEKVQQVQEVSLSNDHLTTVVPKQLPDRDNKPPESRGLLTRRPVSARKLRKLDTETGDNTVVTQTVSELPPINKSKVPNSKQVNSRGKIKAIPISKSNTSVVNTSVNSPESSPDAVCRKSYNESGIDSETEEPELQSIEEEDLLLYSELIEAFRLLWDTLSPSIISDLLKEYRKREAILIQSVIEHAKKQNASNKGQEGNNTVDGSESSNDTRLPKINNQEQMGQQNSPSLNILKSDQGVKKLDDEFVNQFKEVKDSEGFTVDAFIDSLNVHMKKTRLIRVQSFNLREEAVDWNGNQRSNSFTGFGSPAAQNSNTQPPFLKRQHSFSGVVARQNSFTGSIRQNSFLRSVPGSRTNSYCRTRSRGSTGSSYTYSTTSSGISYGNHSEFSGSSSGAKSALSRESSYGLLTEFEDIEEKDEELKTARESIQSSRANNDSLLPPSGRRSNGPRGTSGQSRERDKNRGQTQTHGLGLVSVETPHTPLRKIEEDALPKVEEMETKVMVRSRPDSGIAVSTSSASYSSSELHKERDLDEHDVATSCQEMLDKVSKVLPDQHNDMKSLVAAITKGLCSAHSKAQALYCWLTSQNPSSFEKCSKKSNSPSGRLKQIHEKKYMFCTMYMDMLKVAGLKSERVDGYVKSADYLPGNTVQSTKFQHSWVAVCMDGHYRLVDPQYGALGDKFFREHYFATSPDELLLSHFPKDKRWLLMNQPATMEAFEGTLKTWPAMFHFNIQPLNMKSVIKTYDGKLSITVLLQNVAVNPQLEYAGPGPEIDTDTLEEKIDHEIRDVDNAETYHVTLPQEGSYYFTVYAHVLEECVDVPVFQYRIVYEDELL